MYWRTLDLKFRKPECHAQFVNFAKSTDHEKLDNIKTFNDKYMNDVVFER